MRKARGLVLAVILLLAVSAQLHAQHDERWSVGICAHYLYNMHSADFARLPGTVSCCSTFSGGHGAGTALGLLTESPLNGSFRLGARVVYLRQDFSMITPEPTFIIVNGQGEDGMFEHRLTGSLQSFGFEPALMYAIAPSLRVTAALRAAVITSTNYEQKEQLTQPDGRGTFLNADGTDSGQRTRNLFVGSLANLSFQLAALLGVRYELPLNTSRSLALCPELWYQQSLTNVTSDVHWTVQSVRAGVSLQWYIQITQDKVHQQERKEITDTLTIPQPIAAVRYATGKVVTSLRTIESAEEFRDITTFRRTDTLFVPQAVPVPESSPRIVLRTSSVDSAGVEHPLAVVRIEEFISTQMNPLLGYVFFDHGSSNIPTRYHALNADQTQHFQLQDLREVSRLDMYHDLLNIVGLRLRQFPDARIRITGCTDDNDIESNNVPLARQRAEVVRDYLLQQWGIQPKRIDVETRGLPASASNTTVKDGAEENRRVELSSDSYEILAPLVITDTLRIATPSTVRIVPELEGAKDVRTWTLALSQRQQQLQEFQGTNTLPNRVEWNMGDTPNSMPLTNDSIVVQLNAVDNRDTTLQARSALAVDLVSLRKKKIERQGDMEIDRYSLILFDVRSAKFTEANLRIITLIRERLREQSGMHIRGYTDRLGEVAYNQALAESRAHATSGQFSRAKNIMVDARGNANLYDNDLPEGRFYSRTVDIEVVTPIKE